ncbi:vacuolar protein-sorting-associated protein 24 [Monosporozyma servazzii]
MDYVKKAIWGPDPKEQHRKIKAALRKNARQIDRNLNELQNLQKRTKDLIKKAAKQDDVKAVKVYAKELYQVNKQYSRMYTSKAQLNSVTMKVEEAYKMKNLTNSMATSTGIMREVNSLVRLPQIQSSMMELEKELMKAGIMTEMVDDTMESLDMGEDEMNEEVEEQVNKIIEEYTTDKFAKVDNIPEHIDLSTGQEEIETPENKVDEEADKMIDDMRQRLRALQS